MKQNLIAFIQTKYPLSEVVRNRAEPLLLRCIIVFSIQLNYEINSTFQSNFSICIHLPMAHRNIIFAGKHVLVSFELFCFCFECEVDGQIKAFAKVPTSHLSEYQYTGVNILRKRINFSGSLFLNIGNSTGFLCCNFHYFVAQNQIGYS